MKNEKLLDLYNDYLVSAFGQTIATGLSTLLKVSGYQGIQVLKPREFADKYLE